MHPNRETADSLTGHIFPPLTNSAISSLISHLCYNKTKSFLGSYTYHLGFLSLCLCSSCFFTCLSLFPFYLNLLEQWSPTFFGTRDQFDGRQFFYGQRRVDGFRMIQVHNIQAHLLLCCPVPNRPWTCTGPWPRGLGPLF